MVDIPTPFNDRDVSFTAAGSETDFTTDYPVFDENDIQVIRTRSAVTSTLTITTDYTVAISATTGYATVTPTGSIVAADTWRLKGVMIAERTSDYQQRAGWQADEVNTDLDRIWMALQEFTRDLAAATVDPQTLPLSLANGGTGAGYASVALLFAAIKQAATTSATGVLEIATDAEFLAQVATDKALVPSNLAATPAFLAHKNGSDQSGVASGSGTAVTFGTEVFDIGGYFASSAWTPPAGKYRVTACLQFTNGNAVDNEALTAEIHVAAALVRRAISYRPGTGGGGVIVSTIVEVNGSQAITVATFKGGAGTGTIEGDATDTWFCGERL